jgi:hypothetical protein
MLILVRTEVRLSQGCTKKLRTIAYAGNNCMMWSCSAAGNEHRREVPLGSRLFLLISAERAHYDRCHTALPMPKSICAPLQSPSHPHRQNPGLGAVWFFFFGYINTGIDILNFDV